MARIPTTGVMTARLASSSSLLSSVTGEDEEGASAPGDDKAWSRPPRSPFLLGQKIQVEVMSFGPLGASVVSF